MHHFRIIIHKHEHSPGTAQAKFGLLRASWSWNGMDWSTWCDTRKLCYLCLWIYSNSPPHRVSSSGLLAYMDSCLSFETMQTVKHHKLFNEQKKQLFPLLSAQNSLSFHLETVFNFKHCANKRTNKLDSTKFSSVFALETFTGPLVGQYRTSCPVASWNHCSLINSTRKKRDFNTQKQCKIEPKKLEKSLQALGNTRIDLNNGIEF